MAASAKQLARLHRVRTLQLNLTRADEARAHATHASEAALSARIASLAEAVSPVHGSTSAAVSMGAAAHYRERLWTSAIAAADRVRAAEHHAGLATQATQSARRDQSAVEKLIDRADAAALMKAMRALEEQAPSGRNRHDPC